jgi:serine/threonine protein kinase
LCLNFILNFHFASFFLLSFYLSFDLSLLFQVIKNNKDYIDQSLDEIKVLKYLAQHADPDIYHFLRLYDYFYFKEHLILVFELLSENLYDIYKFTREGNDINFFNMKNLQSMMRQCFVALEKIHSLGVIHADLKPENIVVKDYVRYVKGWVSKKKKKKVREIYFIFVHMCMFVLMSGVMIYIVHINI